MGVEQTVATAIAQAALGNLVAPVTIHSAGAGSGAPAPLDVMVWSRLNELGDCVGVSVTLAPPRANLASDAINPLTMRESEVLREVASGSTNAHVGTHLQISLGTVKTYLERIHVKLHSSDRASAVAVALQRGWI